MQVCVRSRPVSGLLHCRSSRRARVATMAQAVPAVVSCEWLSERLTQPDIKVLDCSWYMPNMGRNAHQEFKARRIPGAQFWDIDGVADPDTDLPHMLPSEAAFAAAADGLGVSNSDTVVVYDGLGMFSAPRAWWTWKVFGHDKVAVLEGGLSAWAAADLPVDEAEVANAALQASTTAARAASTGGSGGHGYKAKLDKSKVRSLSDMRHLVAPAAAGGGATRPAPEQIVDARSAGRFVGTEPEPRPGLRGGHMPGARNIPFPQVYKDGAMKGATFKSKDELAKVFDGVGVDLDAPVVCSCGSGLTASVLALAIHQVNGSLPAVYDGSWCEWGALQDTPVSTDAP